MIKNTLIGIIGIVAGFIMGYSLNLHGSTSESVVAGSYPTDCGSVTCLTDLYVTGNLTASGATAIMSSLAASSTITQGGSYATSTIATTATLSQSDIRYSLVQFTPNGGSLTVTLPASSTLTSTIPNAGDTVRIAFLNATTTAGITLTVSGGAGTTLLKASSTAAIPAGGIGVLTLMRRINTDILVTLGLSTP